MKKNISTYLLFAATTLMTTSLFAPMKYSWNPEPGSTQIGFSLQNLSDYMIQFQIYNESARAYHRHIFEIPPNGEFGININTNIQTRLKLYYCPETSPNTCSETTLPKADIIETVFPLGKTIYISWDSKELLPQNEGPIRGTTTSGYYLTDNVQKSDYTIRETKLSKVNYPKEIGRNPWEVFPKAQEYAKTLRPAEAYTDATVSQFVLGLSGTPTEGEINQAWETLSAQWNPADHTDEPNFARAVMQIINRSRNNLFNPIIRTNN